MSLFQRRSNQCANVDEYLLMTAVFNGMFLCDTIRVPLLHNNSGNCRHRHFHCITPGMYCTMPLKYKQRTGISEMVYSDVPGSILADAVMACMVNIYC